MNNFCETKQIQKLFNKFLTIPNYTKSKTIALSNMLLRKLGLNIFLINMNKCHSTRKHTQQAVISIT